MNVVHAVWDRVNLGMDAWEVTLDRRDCGNVSATVAALRDGRFAEAYVCVKVPVGNLAMVHALEDEGFRFCETQLSLIDTLEPSPEMRYAAFETGDWEWVAVPKVREAWERVAQKITPGVFDTDRIALDPAFGPEFSCRRYQNWIRNLFSDPSAQLSVARREGEDVAFGVDVVDARTGVRRGILGGAFAAGKGSGVGVLMVLDKSRRPGGCRCRTVVSSNNLTALKLHQGIGRTVYKEMYVFRKINKRENAR